MAVARIDQTRPITYGGAVIQPLGSGVSSFFYTNPARDISEPNETSVNLFNELAGRYLANDWVLKGGVLAASGDSNGPVTNADAVVYYPALKTGQHHTIEGIAWSYSGAPTGGTVVVESPSGVPVYGPFAVTSTGLVADDFATGLKGLSGADMRIRLTAAGAGVQGVVAAKGHRIE